MLLTLLVAVQTAFGHDLGVGQLTIAEQSGNSWHLTAKLPASLQVSDPGAVAGCKVTRDELRIADAVTRMYSWRYECQPSAKGPFTATLHWQREAIAILYLPAHGAPQRELLTATGATIEAELRLDRHILHSNGSAIWYSYWLLGIEHILIGIDHVFFVVALCLVANGRRLLLLVTAFTVGHSMTLILASLDRVSLPAAPVEVCIALSIALVAREAWLPKTQRHHGYLLVVLFGLLHGLGFSGVLEEIGLPDEQVFEPLLAFNIGVETGQLLIIALALGLALPLRDKPKTRKLLRHSIIVLLGSASMYWVLQRGWQILQPVV